MAGQLQDKVALVTVTVTGAGIGCGACALP